MALPKNSGLKVIPNGVQQRDREIQVSGARNHSFRVAVWVANHQIAKAVAFTSPTAATLLPNPSPACWPAIAESAWETGGCRIS